MYSVYVCIYILLSFSFLSGPRNLKCEHAHRNVSSEILVWQRPGSIKKNHEISFMYGYFQIELLNLLRLKTHQISGGSLSKGRAMHLIKDADEKKNSHNFNVACQTYRKLLSEI